MDGAGPNASHLESLKERSGVLVSGCAARADSLRPGAGHSERFSQNARRRDGQVKFHQFVLAGPREFSGVASRAQRSSPRFAKIVEDDKVIPRPRRVSGRAVGAWLRRENSFEDFDDVDHIHFESGFFREFPRNALRQRLPEFKHPARD